MSRLAGGSRWPPCWAWPRGRSRSGSSTGGWSTRRRWRWRAWTWRAPRLLRRHATARRLFRFFVSLMHSPGKTEQRFSAHFPSNFRLWYPICHFSAHMFTDSAYFLPMFRSFSYYFPPNLPIIFRRSCLSGVVLHTAQARVVGGWVRWLTWPPQWYIFVRWILCTKRLIVCFVF